MSTTTNQKANSKLITAGLVGATMLGLTAAMNVTAHADTVVDANHVQVTAGDTLSKIANAHHTTVAKLAADNHIANVNMIHVGDRLNITGAEAAPAPAASVQQQQTAVAPVQRQTVNQPAAQPAAPVQYQAPVQQAPAQGGAQYSSNVGGNDAAAKAWIAQRESGGNYGAQNGQYIGRYQLSSAYLNGDYSPANQERVADQYVATRYGSWSNAQQFWQANGWY